MDNATLAEALNSSVHIAASYGEDSNDSREISTVNTNRLHQIFDTFRNGMTNTNNKKPEPWKPEPSKIAVNDHERAHVQFPAYMSRIKGRKLSPKRPYEIPNLTLFPKKSKKRGENQQQSKQEKQDENIKKKIKSGFIQKVSVLSGGLPSVHSREREKMNLNQTQGTLT